MVCATALTWTVGAAEIDLYGRLNVTLQDSREAAHERVELQSNSSRIGLIGESESGDLADRSSVSVNDINNDYAAIGIRCEF